MKYEEIDQRVTTTHDTVNRLLEYKNGPDALALYFRYIQQRKMQENNQTLSGTRFMMKATGRGQDRFMKAKNILKECNLIEDVQERSPDGKVVGRYVKVNFIIKSAVSEIDTPIPETDTSVSETSTPVSENQSMEKPESGEQVSNTLVEKTNTPVENGKDVIEHEEDISLSSNVTENLKKKKSIINKFNKEDSIKIYDTIKQYSGDMIDGTLDDCAILLSKLKKIKGDPAYNLERIIKAMIEAKLISHYSISNPLKLHEHLATIITKLSSKNKTQTSGDFSNATFE